MKALVAILVFLTTLFGAAIVLPSPWRVLFPLNVVAPEVAPAVLILGAIAIVFSWRRRTIWIIPLLALCIAIAAWPCVEYLRFSHPLLDDAVREPTLAKLREADNLPLGMRFYRPDDDIIRPALVDLHGGAWRFGSPIDEQAFHRRVAAQGYAVFAIAYRHAPEYPHPAQLEDVRAALQSIRDHSQEYRIDPERIVLSGRSAGGHLALLAAYESEADPVSGVIAFYPPTDLARGYSEVPTPDPIDVRQVLRDFIGGAPEQRQQQYREASPLTYIRPRLPPTLLIHGSRDHYVKAEFSRSLHGRLIAAGNRSLLLELPWAEHAFDKVWFGIGNRIAERGIYNFLRRETNRGS